MGKEKNNKSFMDGLLNKSINSLDKKEKVEEKKPVAGFKDVTLTQEMSMRGINFDRKRSVKASNKKVPMSISIDPNLKKWINSHTFHGMRTSKFIEKAILAQFGFNSIEEFYAKANVSDI